MPKALSKGKKARSFSGCKCCKQAKRKCPEEHPQCSICAKLGLKCEYDVDFLFRRESVDTDGYVSKAPRITRPAPRESTRLQVTTCPDFVPLPHRVMEYQFIDESAWIMSPTLSQHKSPSPAPTPSTSDSPRSAFSLLLEAAATKPFTAVTHHQVPTPPQSPGESYEEMRPQISRVSRGSLYYILN